MIRKDFKLWEAYTPEKQIKEKNLSHWHWMVFIPTEKLNRNEFRGIAMNPLANKFNGINNETTMLWNSSVRSSKFRELNHRVALLCILGVTDESYSFVHNSLLTI